MSRRNHLIQRSVKAISDLSSLASPNGPSGTTHIDGEATPTIRQAIDWETIDERERLEILHDMKAGIGILDTDRLFWLIRSLARLDINLFEIDQRLPFRMIQNLKDNDDNNTLLKKPTEKELPAFHFPKVIWALSIFLRKYAENDDDLKSDLLECIQERLDILTEKANNLEGNDREIFYLAKTKIFLTPFLDRLKWPEALDDLVTDDILRSNEEHQSSFERDIITRLKYLAYDRNFEPSYWDQASAHTIDIAFPDEKFAIEVEGPGHFYAREIETRRQLETTKHVDVTTWERNTVLEDNGWTVIIIPYYEWPTTDGKKDNYLLKKLRDMFPTNDKTASRARRPAAKSASAATHGSRFRLLADLSDDDESGVEKTANSPGLTRS